MQQDILINGTAIHTEFPQVSPGRPTIVFLHDSLGCISLWKEFPKELAKRTHCNLLVYDRQGYGRSAPFASIDRENDYLEKEADILIQLLDACSLEKAILFGHSDGGSIALIAAAKYPERTRAIITEGAHIFVEEITLNGIREAVKAWQTTDLRPRLERYHGQNTGAVFHAWTNTWLHPKFRSWNIENFLPQIKCPVLVIQGEKDEFGSMAQVDGIMDSVSGAAEKLIVAGAAHTPHKENKEMVLEKAAAFIARH